MANQLNPSNPSNPSSPFDPANTARVVHETLDQSLAVIPDGHNSVVLIKAEDVGGEVSAELLFATRVHKGEKFEWDLGAGIKYSGGDVRAGVTTMFSW